MVCRWFLLLAGAWCLSGQQISPSNLWLIYNGDHPLTERWGVHFDGHFRLHNFGVEQNQWLLRPGVNYQFSRTWAASAGYTLQRGRQLDTAEQTIFDQRLYQHVTHTFRWGRVQWQQRFRAEQRWTEFEHPPASLFRQWWRYRLRATVPLRRGSYFSVNDEIFAYLPRFNGHILDQNRLTFAVGWPVARDTRLEISYFRQDRPAAFLPSLRHTVQVSLLSTRGLRRR